MNQMPHLTAQARLRLGVVVLVLIALALSLWIVVLPALGQPGDPTVRDPFTTAGVEDPPYTDPFAVFNPQLSQAPKKDSITWNPIWMYELETPDENRDLYHHIYLGDRNGSEKVWFRMWYEPEHWDKDLNANRVLDRDSSYRPTSTDEWYPAIMQEFTYMMMEPKRLADKPEPAWAQMGISKFVFPVGVRMADLGNTSRGYGLTSLDANFDGTPEIVHLDSELSLSQGPYINHFRIDFDGDGVIQKLDQDGTPLSGDELLILHLDTIELHVGDSLQFLDFYLGLDNVSSDGARLIIYYNGNIALGMSVTKLVPERQFIIANPSTVFGPYNSDQIGHVRGPFFAYVDTVDPTEARARIVVGRALGATHSGMEDAPYSPDLRPGDPWWLKRFYVDGHEYNVVAIYARNFAGETDSRFQFITIRTPLPKGPDTYFIDQHSVYLEEYNTNEQLSVMPPYNHEHYILGDVQAITEFTCGTDLTAAESAVHYLGPLIGPVAPILQDNVSLPYVTRDGLRTYSSPLDTQMYYVREGPNEQYIGELKQKYGEDRSDGSEFWYVEQFHSLPWYYTEFVLPDIPGVNELYLLTAAYTAPQSEYLQWMQGRPADTGRYNLRWDDTVDCWVRDEGVSAMPGSGWQPRVKFWFDPAQGGPKYKTLEGVRLYGYDGRSAGDSTATDRLAPTYPVEVYPYTDPWAPFNPHLPQAPRKDSLTFDPAYMNEFDHTGEPIHALYGRIRTENGDAREKVFLRMWYEPEYMDKILTSSSVYTFPALLQEYTYMLLDTTDKPTHGQPGQTTMVFPMATGYRELPGLVAGAPDPAWLPSAGWGVTSFDCNFDDINDIVTVHSERSLEKRTHIAADFDGDGGALDQLDQDGVPLSGDEMVILAVDDVELARGQSAQFLDYMVYLDNVSASGAEFRIWRTGGGTGPSLQPYQIGFVTLAAGEMAIAGRTDTWYRKIPAGGNNLGSMDGPWFVWVSGINPTTKMAWVMVGRALGASRSAMDNGAGAHDLTPGDPWYLKRFFVDGHEYNVTAVHVVPADYVNPTWEQYEFKYITIRTPIPKQEFVNYQDSQRLQDYGIDDYLPFVPPFNAYHTAMQDIQAITEADFANPLSYDADCHGSIYARPGLSVRLTDEDVEPQFSGELKEKYWRIGSTDLWSTEQFRIIPQHYSTLLLADVPGITEYYLLTTDWWSDQSRVHFYGCDAITITQNALHGLNSNIPATNTDPAVGEDYFTADPAHPLRLTLLYAPTDTIDPYINVVSARNTLRVYGETDYSAAPAAAPTPTPTRTPTRTPTPTATPSGTGGISGVVLLFGRTNHSGTTVTASGPVVATTTTGASGSFSFGGLPAGTYTVRASKQNYIYAEKTGVVVSAGVNTDIGTAQLPAGDLNDDCRVNIIDLVIIATDPGWSDPSPCRIPINPRADVNGDGCLNVMDLVCAGRNYDATCPAPWAMVPSVMTMAASPEPARVFLDPAWTRVEMGEFITINVKIENASNLYGTEFEIAFEPTVLQVVDSDAAVEGVQITPGPFVDLGPDQSYIGPNNADNAAGRILFVATRSGSAEPGQGDGTLASITFWVVNEGSSALTFKRLALSDAEGGALDATASGGTVSAFAEAWIYMPIVHKK
ncbi:MAG: carboxypeptidase regulatory-like domain-containing protein [Chloroflexi bacterium]|nr:carboxypeptidase regulatory-like domain-containing protein [Chloroflexota bacterium]